MFIPLLMLIILIVAYRRQQKMRPLHPEYRFFLPGLMAKFFGSLVFAFIYIFYYKGGDTFNYYEAARAMSNLAEVDVLDFFKVLFSEPSMENLSLFTSHTSYPPTFIYFDSKTFMVVRLISPLVILTGKSYLLSTILLSYFSFFGIWKLFRMFVSYYPAIDKLLAIAIIFFPSSLFWGSGLIKDTFTLAASCYFIVYIHKVFILKKMSFSNILFLVIASFIILSIKPYIFMVILPGTLLWIFFDRLSQLKNKVVIFVLLPLTYLLVLGASFALLSSLGGVLDKFALDKALVTAAVTQQDLKSERYQGNSFDIGGFEPTVPGVLSKFPIASFSGLYRPFLWEAKNVTMLISGVENAFLFGFTIYLLIVTNVVGFFKSIFNTPIVFFSILFSVSFAFVIGLTTSNFGALVRFKIPLLPLFVASLFIIHYVYKTQKAKNFSGVR